MMGLTIVHYFRSVYTAVLVGCQLCCSVPWLDTHRCQKTTPAFCSLQGCSISPSTEVRNLVVILDSTLSYQSHIKSVTRPAFFHLKNISRLRPSLTDSVAETLIHSFISSRLDYCNGVLFGLPNTVLDRLQNVQNSAARVLTRTRRWQHITPTLKHLHWLPVKFRITYKLLLLTYKALHALAPQYLSDLLEDYSPERNLRSVDQVVTVKNKILSRGPPVEDFCF